MKRTIFFSSLFALALSSNAQFKVQSDGKIAVQTTSTASSPISINGAGNSLYYMYCGNTANKSGLLFSAHGNNSSSTIYGGNFSASSATPAIGIRGSASTSSTCIGVLGYADSGTKTLGIIGSLNQSYITTGAAVYGTVYNDYGSGLSSGDKYAGFFRGNVKATGSIIASTTLQGALLGESSSSMSPSDESLSLRVLSPRSGLSGLHVTSYKKLRPALPEDTKTISDLDGDSAKSTEVIQPEKDIIDEQFYEKNHYALDADQLEATFPDLVYVNKDGSKAINYMEMIPLLVQSINELSAEIENLKGRASGDRVKVASRGETSIEQSLTSKNKLYQNTPNPFKEQTTIRFSLADDVRDAAICIFDMTGKTIRKMPVSSGMESISFGGYELGEGMFLYSLIVNGQEIDTKKMIISK